MRVYYRIAERPSPVVKSSTSPTGATAPSAPPLLTNNRGVAGERSQNQLGRYQLIRRLAVGGMAEVFLARVVGPGDFEKIVVCKRMMPECVDNKKLVRMFLDEARLLARLDHPNITQVHDMGDQDGVPYFAMEYVHGEDLRTIMRAATTNGVRIPDGIAAMIISEAAHALHYAHERQDEQGSPLNIVHRDVSPSNILVSYHGGIKVADFGIAKSALQQTETRAGTLKGKLSYMAPEQARGDAVDRRTDVFALGILLYELTTDTRLFQGATDMAVLKQVTHCQITPPSRRRADYPPALAAIVMRALSRSPEDRYPDARSLAGALHDFARASQQPCDTGDRETFLRLLFANKLAVWQEAEQHGQTLGEHLTQMARHGTATEGSSGDEDDGGSDIPVEIGDTTLVDGNAVSARVSLAMASTFSPSQSGHRYRVPAAIFAGIVLLLFIGLRWYRPPLELPAKPVANQPQKATVPRPTHDVIHPFPPKPTLVPPAPNRSPPARQRSRAASPPPRTEIHQPQVPTREKIRVWDPDSVLLPPK
jgi:serine/threonine protein kinase